MKQEDSKSPSRRVTLLLGLSEHEELLKLAAARALAQGRPVGLSEVAREIVTLGLAVGIREPREAA
jgi:hypothetical protein